MVAINSRTQETKAADSGPPSAPSPAARPASPATPDMHCAYLDHVCFVMAFARTLGIRGKSDQEDVAHEVFAIAWEQLDRYEPARGTVRAWLASIAIHKAQSWRRLARNRLDHTADLDQEHDPERDQEQRTAARQIRMIARGLVDELPEDLRIALELIDFHEFTMQEAADALRLPLGTLRTRYYKARSEFQKKIDRLQKQRKLTRDDLRGLPLPIPTGIGQMFDALRTSDLAVDRPTSDRIWERVLSEPAPPGSPSRGAPPPAPPPAAPSPHGPMATTAVATTAPLAARLLATGPVGAAGAKLAGTVLAFVAAVGAGAALHAAVTERPPPAPVVAVAELVAANDQPAAPQAPSAPTAVGPATSAPVTAAPTSAATSNESETSLIERMRAALANRPGEVIKLAEKHARTYPGKHGQEREALVILALARTGRRAEAQARAQSFRAAYPKSQYVAIIDAEMGGSGQ